MSVYAKRDKWWFNFRFAGKHIQESTGIAVTGKNRQGGKAEAKQIEAARKQALTERPELATIRKESPVTFSEAAQALIRKRVKWSAKTKLMRVNSLNRLTCFDGGEKATDEIKARRIDVNLGKLFLREITANHIAEYVGARLKQSDRDPAANRSINLDLELIRMTMIENKSWERVKEDTGKLWLLENEDVGQALTVKQSLALLEAAKQSISRSLYPALLISIHTGLRSQELRTLTWGNVDLAEGKVRVSKSKTHAGKGREVYLSDDALAVLTDWKTKFKNVKPAHYVFCQEKYKMMPNEKTIPNNSKFVINAGSIVSSMDVTKPIGSWKRSFKTARVKAGIEHLRWHDLRHTCASLLAAGRTPERVMQATLGWDPKSKMAQRYSHVVIEQKRAAASLMAGIS
jgi:integrase